MDKKKCTKCKKEKSLTEFRSRGGKYKHLLKSQCNKCLKAQHKEWCKKNPERVSQYRATEDALHKRCQRRNINVETFFKVFEDQSYECKICSAPITLENSAIDHNHDTGEFRGVLCRNCNRALGLFKDNPEILKKAAIYLETEGHYG